MDLWIRTQYNGLQQIVGIEEPFKIMHEDYWCLQGYNKIKQFDLGKYNSKERALEVLNEIQNNIESFCILKHTDNSFNEKNEYFSCHVYEMPKE